LIARSVELHGETPALNEANDPLQTLYDGGLTARFPVGNAAMFDVHGVTGVPNGELPETV
jgi:hypothetical protein